MCNCISLHLHISLSPHRYLSSLSLYHLPVYLSLYLYHLSLYLAKTEIHYKELAYMIVAGDSGTVAATVPVRRHLLAEFPLL